MSASSFTDTYVQNILSVHRDLNNKLYHLTLSIQCLLLFYDKFMLPSGSEIPVQCVIFNHGMQLFYDHASSLCFLSLTKWSASDCDVKALLTFLEFFCADKHNR